MDATAGDTGAETLAVAGATAMETLATAIDGLRGVDAADVAAGELTGLVRGVTREINRLEALRSSWVREVHRRRAYESDGHRSPSGWLADQTAEDRRRAAGRVRTASRLRWAPRTKAAFDDGAISERHAEVIARTLEQASRDGTEAADRDRLEAELVELAGRVGPGEVARHARRRRIEADHDAAAERAQARHEDRYLRLTDRGDGMVAADGLLTSDDAEAVRTALDALMRPEPGDIGEDERASHGQRMADALGELARRLLDADVLPDKAGRRPHVAVTVDLATLTGQDGAAGELEWGGPIPAATALRICCDAELTRIVVDPDSVPLELGRTTRTPTRALRAAVIARDKTCRRCAAPPAWCEPHHIWHWAHGGPTDLHNLVLLCRGCHRLVHEGGWQVTLHDDNTVTFTAPDGRRHRRRPAA